jgi:membrane protease YdiL (CAAX protease family)
MGRGAMNTGIGNKIEAFLRHESFYIAVLLAVVAIGVIQTVRVSFDEGPVEDAAPIMTYQEFRSQTYYRATDFNSEEDAAYAPYLAVRAVYLCLLVVGLFAAAVAAFIWISWGFKDTPPLDAPPWGLWDVLKVAAVFAAGAHVFHWILPGNPYQPFIHPNDWIAEAFARVLLIGTVIYVATGERNARPAELGIRGSVKHALLAGTVCILVLQPVLRAIETLMLRQVEPWPLQFALQAVLQTKSPLTLAGAVVVALVLTPIAEELFFRGFLQPALQRWVGPWSAIFLGAAFFAVAHMDLYAIPPMLALGIGLGWVYYRTKSLLAPVLVHAVHNGLVLMLFLSSRPLMPAS